MPQVISQTEPGEILDIERRSVELHDLVSVIQRRHTVRLASGTGEIHVDCYPAAVPGSNGQPGATKGSVVFVGGLSNYALGYAAFEERLSRRGFNVFAVDLRGHGRSSGDPGDFTMDDVIEDLRTTVDYAREQGTGPVALMGSSLGGFYALAGANAIDNVDVCVNHWIMLPDMPVTKADRRMRPMVKVLNRLAPRMKRDTRTIANWDAVCDDPRLIEKVYEDPLMVFEYTVRALAGGIQYAPTPPLTELQMPHLVILGERDEMTPLSYTKRVVDRLEGDVDFHIVPNAGHMGGLVEHQDEMVSVVDLWLTTKMTQLEPGADHRREPAGTA